MFPVITVLMGETPVVEMRNVVTHRPLKPCPCVTIPLIAMPALPKLISERQLYPLQHHAPRPLRSGELHDAAPNVSYVSVPRTPWYEGAWISRVSSTPIPVEYVPAGQDRHVVPAGQLAYLPLTHFRVGGLLMRNDVPSAGLKQLPDPGLLCVPVGQLMQALAPASLNLFSGHTTQGLHTDPPPGLYSPGLHCWHASALPCTTLP